MTLPVGTISMSQVNVELGLSATATISLNQSNVRTLAGVPSGTISMDNLRGKTNEFALTISTDQVDANLRTLAINAGWNGTIPVRATINAGVFISGSVPGNSTPALTINGSFPNGVSLINNGTIAGDGGNGGAGGAAAQSTSGTTVGSAGSTGGLALTVSVPVSITNNGTIAGGGGGGGGGGGVYWAWTYGASGNDAFLWQPGGGGGGGRANASYSSSGGAAGSISGSGSGGSISSVVQLVNVAAGGSGTSSAAGAGGAGGSRRGTGGTTRTVTGGTGGAGGGWGTAGSTGATATASGSATAMRAGGAGGGAGNAISGNSNITWVAFGTRLGAIA